MIDLERTLYVDARRQEGERRVRQDPQVEAGRARQKQKDLQKAAADLDKQATVLKPEVLKAKKDELEKSSSTSSSSKVKLERDLAGERTQLIQDLLKKASPIVGHREGRGCPLIVDQSAVRVGRPVGRSHREAQRQMK